MGYLLLERRRERKSTGWTRRAMLPNAVRRPRPRWRLVPMALFLVGLALLLVGFARPQQALGRSHGGPPTIVLALDVSGSMAATDVRPDRIGAARALAIRFLRELPAAYSVAVVAFGNTASLVVPPTTDRGRIIAALPTAAIPKAGTAIGDGINYSVATVAAAAGQPQPGSLYRPGAVLVFSDGGQNAGGTTPAQAAVSAAVDYVPVDSIAVGTTRGTVSQRLTVPGLATSTTIPVPVQPSTLRTVSRETQGSFFDAAAVQRDPSLLDGVYRNLRVHVTTQSGTRNLSAAATAIGLVLIIGGGILSGLWFGRIA